MTSLLDRFGSYPGTLLATAALSALVVATLCLVLSHYLRGHHKANVHISFTKNAFAFGESVSGSFECEFKRAVECTRIVVLLYRVDTKHPEKGRSRVVRHRQDEMSVKVGKGLGEGSRLRHSFRLQTPTQAGQLIDGVVQTAGRLFFDADRVDHSWEVAVCIKVDGIDVEYTRRVSIF